MEELYGEFFNAMNQIRKIRIGDLFSDLTEADGMTLMAVSHAKRGAKNGILTVSELAEKLHTQPSAVSRSLKSLEEQGLIERTINSTDRRNTYVALSEYGQSTCEKIERTMSDFAQAVLSRMKKEDLERLVAYLNELYQVAMEEIEVRKNK